jgi:hypothetical protein
MNRKLEFGDHVDGMGPDSVSEKKSGSSFRNTVFFFFFFPVSSLSTVSAVSAGLKRERERAEH